MSREAKIENNAHGVALMDFLGIRRGDPATVEADRALYACTVAPQWVDLNGHMNVNLYGLIFDLASDLLNQYLAFTDDYVVETGNSIFSAESHICYLAEAHKGAPLKIEARVLDYDEKRLHHYVEMRAGADGRLVAASEMMFLHFSLKKPGVAPMEPQVLSRVEAVHRVHGDLPPPTHAGRRIGVPHKN